MSTPIALSRRALTRSRAAAVAAMLSLLSLLVVTPADAQVDMSAEARFVAEINAERASRGLSQLTVASDLVAVARSHSQTMGSESHLYHNPNLGSDVGGWLRVGENVGKGPSVGALHRAFMESPSHKANILGDYDRVGVGVGHDDAGKIYVTVMFMKSKAAPAWMASAYMSVASSRAAPVRMRAIR